ncbi:MAG: hypothetical protein A4E61_01603 [Syntrophorhabdus sp. PtaB.Bin184]|nr:MAG: hypothetical protein A4E61_01603 [Syntrophorhabdus sp. PtaB.Bin184]
MGCPSSLFRKETMAKPNKYRRALNRLNVTRADMTEVQGSPSTERVGLIGYENYYEITRRGEVYSKRLHRFIKHKFFSFGDRYSTYVEFQLDGRKVRIAIGEAVAKSFLSRDQIHTISKQLPEGVNTLKDLWGLDIIPSLAKEYDVITKAVFYILSNEFSDRQSRGDR